VPILNSENERVGEMIEWCWYRPYEEGTDSELEDVMTTFVDQERPLKSSLKRLCAKKWEECLQAAEDKLPKSIWDMLSECETPWVTRVTATDGPDQEADDGETDDEETDDEETDDEETDDEETDDGETNEGDQSGATNESSPLAKNLLFAGEAFAQVPPYLGSSLDNAAEQNLAIRTFLQRESDKRALQSWQNFSTTRRLWASKHAGEEGMGFGTRRNLT
jgi:hypothetical protein